MITKYYALDHSVLNKMIAAFVAGSAAATSGRNDRLRARYVSYSDGEFSLKTIGDDGAAHNVAAMIVGTRSFGIIGNDVDFSLVGIEVGDKSEFAVDSDISMAAYPNQGVLAMCERVDVGIYSFMALPEFRVKADIAAYHAAAARYIPAIGGVSEWIKMREEVGKEYAYEAVGIPVKKSCVVLM